MATIDNAYFFGELMLSQVSSAEGAAALQLIIDSRENELLTRLFGYELYKVYKAGIVANTQIYKDIRDGKEYTNGIGKPDKWVGLTFTVGTSKQSLIANYVYWHYIRDNYTFTTGSSEKKSSLALNALPDQKLVRAWNQMVDWIYQLHDFLTVNAAVYPEYANVVLCTELFTKQNTLNL
jgi:hypothetical protein